MKIKELILKIFEVKKTNLHSKQYVIPSKKISRSVGDVEKMILKNKVLLGGWISMAARVFRSEKNMRGENLLGRFEDWMHKNCGMKKQTTYNYKNLYKLMKMTPRLTNCRVTRTYFVLNHDILFNYFYEENEE